MNCYLNWLKIIVCLFICLNGGNVPIKGEIKLQCDLERRDYSFLHKTLKDLSSTSNELSNWPNKMEPIK